MIWLAGLAAIFPQAREANGKLSRDFAQYHSEELRDKEPCDLMRQAPSTPETDQKQADDWVALANHNINCGGPVWSVFQKYYGANP
jgi:hypothetical protein